MLAGGLLGSIARAGVYALLPGTGFPVATLVVNLVGSLLLGLYLGSRRRAVVARPSLEFWAIGALGSFTTFSTFSVEVIHLLDAGAAVAAGAYVVASTVGGLVAVLLGDRLGGFRP